MSSVGNGKENIAYCANLSYEWYLNIEKALHVLVMIKIQQQWLIRQNTRQPKISLEWQGSIKNYTFPYCWCLLWGFSKTEHNDPIQTSDQDKILNIKLCYRLVLVCRKLTAQWTPSKKKMQRFLLNTIVW